MSSQETKSKILEVSISLFNKLGAANVSTNRIAEECGISKGNLNYHYKNKKEIILDIFSLLRDEINGNWSGDDLTPTINHMKFMFLRQLYMICKYRFFYRDLVHILNSDPVLRSRYNDLRKRRMDSLRKFLSALAEEGYIVLPADARDLDRFITSTWVLSEHWINYAETFGNEIDDAMIRHGYEVFTSMMRPHLTEAGERLFVSSDPVDLSKILV